MPLYVRAGAVIPMAPVRQYVDEPTDEPPVLVVYPGADGESEWYEDDGRTFAYRRGEFMRVQMTWRDAARQLDLRLARGSTMLSPEPRRIMVRIAGSAKTTPITFSGKPVSVRV